jgi:hypothetical protein
MVYNVVMMKRRGKQGPEDINEIAFRVFSEATVEHEKTSARESLNGHGHKHDAGVLGGKARANKLTPDERSAIAKRAAQMRWHSTKT